MPRLDLTKYVSIASTLLLASLAHSQPAGFPSRDDIVNEMRAAAGNHPNICQFFDLTARYGTPPTHQGRALYAVKISDNVTVEEDEPAFMMVSAHHGNEYGTPIVALDAIARLTQGYASDPTIRSVVDNNEIWIAPLWNPDGYHTSRHNARPGGTVDLNRNYPFLWNSACNTGVRGPSPGSEPETQTMVAWSEDQRFAKVLDYHSSGRETLHGYRSGCELHPSAAYLQAEAIAISQASSYGGAVRGPSSNGEHYQWQLGAYSNYAFLTEISNTQSPTRTSADQEAARVWPGTLFMLQRPIPIWGRVTDAVTGAPLDADITYVGTPFANGERNRSEPLFGRYHAFLPTGSHTLRFSRPGYSDRLVPVTVTAAGVQVDVAMTPPGLSFSFSGGVPTQLEPGGGTTVRVTVMPGARTPASGTGMLQVSSSNETRTFVMNEVAPNVYDATFPGFACGDAIQFSISAEDTMGQVWNSPPGGSYAAETVSTARVIASANFESAGGWVGGQPGDSAIRGIWNRADPEPTAAQPGDDHTPGAGRLCWVTDSRAGTSIGAWDVDSGVTTLLSARYDLSSEPNAMISYWRWYSNNQNGQRDDALVIDISNDDGQTWSNVETVGPNGVQAAGSWFQHSFRVADFVVPSGMMRMRFRAQDQTPGSIVEAAIDDFVISVPQCDGEVKRLGMGCTDATATPLRMTHAGSVRLGQTLELGLDAGSALPYAISVGPEITPFTIPGTGAPGCQVFVNPLVSISPVPNGASLSIAVPNDAALVGQGLAWQAAIVDPGLMRMVQIATSDYLLTTVGS